MTRIPVFARARSRMSRVVLAFGAGTTLLFGASACSFETVFSTTEDDSTADRAPALSAPGSADLWRTSGTGPDSLNDDAEPGTPMEFVDPALLEDGELPPRMTVTEAQSLQVFQKLADMVQEEGRRISEVATLRVYLTPENGTDDGADFAGWNRAYRTFFANLDPLTGDSLLTGTSAVTLTAETSPSTTSEPSDPQAPPTATHRRTTRPPRRPLTRNRPTRPAGSTMTPMTPTMTIRGTPGKPTPPSRRWSPWAWPSSPSKDGWCRSRRK